MSRASGGRGHAPKPAQVAGGSLPGNHSSVSGRTGAWDGAGPRSAGSLLGMS